MKSQTITSKWYDETGERCLRFYKKSQDNEIIQLKELLEKIPPKSKIVKRSLTPPANTLVVCSPAGSVSSLRTHTASSEPSHCFHIFAS